MQPLTRVAALISQSETRTKIHFAKKWFKTAISALSSGQNNLQAPIEVADSPAVFLT